MAAEQMAERPDGDGAPEDPAAPPPRPLDAIDQDILRMLQADGRASIRSVAERVHVSRANAYARINRLVEDGVIRGFGARVDHERAGHGTSAYITLKIVQNTWRTVRAELRQLPGASHIALVGATSTSCSWCTPPTTGPCASWCSPASRPSRRCSAPAPCWCSRPRTWSRRPDRRGHGTGGRLRSPCAAPRTPAAPPRRPPRARPRRRCRPGRRDRRAGTTRRSS